MLLEIAEIFLGVIVHTLKFGVELIDLAIQIGLHRIGQHLGLSLQFVLRVGQTLLFPLEILLPLVHFRHESFLSLFTLGVFNDSLLKIDNCYSAGSR